MEDPSFSRVLASPAFFAPCAKTKRALPFRDRPLVDGIREVNQPSRLEQNRWMREQASSSSASDVA